MKRQFLAMAASLLILLPAILPAGAVPPAPWEADELVGKPAPSFTLLNMNGRNVSIASLRGKVVLINFWATWCPPCKDEIPSLNALYEKYRGRDFVLLAVSTDSSREDVEKFMKKYGVKFMVLLDGDSRVMRQYRVFSLPMSFLIDRKGRVVEKFLGAREWEGAEFTKKINDLL